MSVETAVSFRHAEPHMNIKDYEGVSIARRCSMHRDTGRTPIGKRRGGRRSAPSSTAQSGHKGRLRHQLSGP